MAERYEFPGRFLSLPTLKSEGEQTAYDDVGVGTEPEPTWFDLFVEEAEEHRETFADIISGAGLTTVSEMRERTPDYGEKGWTIWTPGRVYFPVVYDGQWSVGSVPRHPTTEITKPMGGGG